MSKHEPKEKNQPAELEQQVIALTEALQRERADAINARARFEQQLGNVKQLAKAHVMRELLPTIDGLERALKHVPEDLTGHKYVAGIQGVLKQFEKTLLELNVQRIKTLGELFDPRIHEAVGMEEGTGDKEVVSEELQSGYIMGDEVLRHAMVKVKLT